MKRFLVDGWRQLSAPPCRLCATNAAGPLCMACVESLPWNDCACERCAQPLPTMQRLCVRCQRRAPPYDHAESSFRLEAPIQQMIYGLKSHARLDNAELLARLMTRARPSFVEDHSLLVPVPLFRHRLRRRGYNQALELARGLAKRLQLRCDGLAVTQIRASRDLTRLNRPARRREVRGAYAVDPARVRGQALVLVDDVMTTGATVESISRLCRQAGAASISVWTAARTP